MRRMDLPLVQLSCAGCLRWLIQTQRLGQGWVSNIHFKLLVCCLRQKMDSSIVLPGGWGWPQSFEEAFGLSPAECVRQSIRRLVQEQAEVVRWVGGGGGGGGASF